MSEDRVEYGTYAGFLLIDQQDYERNGHAATNFKRTLPALEVLRWGRLSSLPKHQIDYRWGKQAGKPAPQAKAGRNAYSTSRLEHATI